MTSHATTADQPRFHLHVCRGRTEHPSRPIDRETFLVGSGEPCHVRLGDDVVPALHSALRVVDDFVEVVAIAEEPPLLVNGITTRDALLEHGDVFSIGGIEFELSDAGLAAESVAAPDPAELTAAELVDQLGRDLDLEELTDAVDDRRHAGAEALYEAIRHRYEERALERVSTRIEAVAQDLENRRRQLVAQESRITRAARDLAETQRGLEERLQRLETRLAETDPSRRAA